MNESKTQLSAKKEYKKKKMGIIDYVFFLLGRRDYSYSEIYKKLIDREEDPKEIKEKLQLMVDKNYISDERMAESYFRTRKSRKGSRVIRQELKMKGISNEIIDKVIDENDDESENIENILRFIRRFIDHDLDDHNIKNKIFRKIVSKGFTFEQAKIAINELKEEKERNKQA